MKLEPTVGSTQLLPALERLKSSIRRILEPTKWDSYEDYAHQITRLNILSVSCFILLVHVVVSPSDWLIFGNTGFVETITRWRQTLTGLVLLTCATMLMFPRAHWTKWVYWTTACTAIVASYALMGRFALTYNAGFAFKLFGPMLPLLTIESLNRRVQFTGLTITIIIGSTLVFLPELAFSFNGFIYTVYLFLSGSVSVGAGFITTLILRENYEQAWKLRRLNDGLEDLVQERARQATLALERLTHERAAVSKELARELHDEMGAHLAILNFQLANMLHTRETLQEEAADKYLQSAQQTVASLEAGIRSIINQYRQTQGGEGMVKAVVLGPIDSFTEHWSGMVEVSIIPAQLALTPGQLLSIS